MGWRDTQAAVQSGQLNFKPKDDTLGRAFASAADIIANKWIDDASTLKAKKLEQEKEEKTERERIEQERRDAETTDRAARKTAKAALLTARVPWSQAAENRAFQMVQGGSTQIQVASFFELGLQKGDIILDAAPVQGPMPAVAPTTSVLTKYESGAGGADALLNQAQNRDFGNIRVSSMSVKDVLDFQTKRGVGSYFNYSKANMPAGTQAAEKGLGSTPVGKYQFVGETLKDLKDRGIFDELGITDETIFDEKTQDALFVRYAQDRLQGKETPEERRAAMRGAWEGLRKASDSEVDDVIAQVETGLFDSAATQPSRADKIKPGENIEFVYSNKDDGTRSKNLSFTIDPSGILKFGSRSFDTNSEEFNTVDKLEAALAEFNAVTNPDLVAVVQRKPTEGLVEAQRPAEFDGGFMVKPQTKLGLDIDQYISAIDEPADMTKQIARVENNSTMTDDEKKDAKDRILKYVTQLPKAKMTNADLAKLEKDELDALAALLTQELQVTPDGEFNDQQVLLDRVKTAIGAKTEAFDVTEYDDVSTPTVKTKIAATNTPEDERVQLQALLINRDEDKEFKLLPNSPSYITTFDVLDTNGQPTGEQQVTTTMLSEDGQTHIDLSTGNQVTPVKQPINRGEQRELAADFAKINTALIKPLKEARTNMTLSVQSAKTLADIVQRTPNVQSTLGGDFPRLLKRIGIEITAAEDLFFGGGSAGEFEVELNRRLLSENVQGAARDAALYQAELYKFAFAYASARLGQSGQGLSNKDFEKALQIVASGQGQTFITGLKAKVAEIIQISDTAIDDFNEDGSVIIMDQLDTSGKLLSGYRRTSQEYAEARGFGEAYAWAKAPEQSERPPRPASLEGLPRPTSRAERDALPRGWYVTPDNTLAFKE